jgi:hypothetical protein
MTPPDQGTTGMATDAGVGPADGGTDAGSSSKTPDRGKSRGSGGGGSGSAGSGSAGSGSANR